MNLFGLSFVLYGGVCKLEDGAQPNDRNLQRKKKSQKKKQKKQTNKQVLPDKDTILLFKVQYLASVHPVDLLNVLKLPFCAATILYVLAYAST